MSILNQIRSSMQQFADVVKAAIKLDMDIFDDRLTRVAGTGVARAGIGRKIQEKGVVNRHIFAGQDQIIIDNPGKEDNCRECAHFGRCAYKKAVYAAIRHKDKTIGAMGILAFDDEQAAILNDRKLEHLAFIRQIASLMESKIKDFMTTRALRHEISGGGQHRCPSRYPGSEPGVHRINRQNQTPGGQPFHHSSHGRDRDG